MEKYGIYRNIIAGETWYESLICIVFNEQDAHKLVQAYRQQMGNQLCFFRKIK